MSLKAEKKRERKVTFSKFQQHMFIISKDEICAGAHTITDPAIADVVETASPLLSIYFCHVKSKTINQDLRSVFFSSFFSPKFPLTFSTTRFLTNSWWWPDRIKTYCLKHHCIITLIPIEKTSEDTCVS